VNKGTFVLLCHVNKGTIVLLCHVSKGTIVLNKCPFTHMT
jgi:hypothetical protein